MYSCPICRKFVGEVVGLGLESTTPKVFGMCKDHGKVEVDDWDGDDFYDIRRCGEIPKGR